MRNTFTVLNSALAVMLCWGFFVFTSLKQANASHVMGADITYECLSNDSYLIRLKVYRNCGGANLNAKLPLAFSSQSCGYAMQIDSATRVSIRDVSPLCAAQQQLSNCINPSFPFPGVEEHIYELIIDFPLDCPDWIVGWSLCCRDPSVTNSVIPSFSSTRIYIEALINNTLDNCNSSPDFVTKPVTYICDNQPVSFNSGATEPDKDSIQFELIDPLDGNYVSAPVPVPYVSGFNINYPIATNPANQFNFDPGTGQFNFVPNGLQKGIVAVKVNEYRNGQLIGYTMRDMQWVVIPCVNQNPVIMPPFNISGGQFSNNVFSVCAGDELRFALMGLDDPIDSLFLTTTSINGATITSSGANPLTASFTWNTSIQDTGTYFISFIFEDNGCPTTGQASVGFKIVVGEGTILPPQDIFYCPSTTDTVFLQATAAGVGSYSWSPTAGLEDSTIRDPYVIIPPSGMADLFVTYRDSPSCDVIEPFHIEPEATVNVAPDTVEICAGDSAQLSATFSVNGAPVSNIDLQWNPAIGLSNPVRANPLASPPASQLYTLTITSPSLNCSYEADVFVIVNQAPDLDPLADTLICAGASAPLSLAGSSLMNANISWAPTLSLSNSTILNPVATPGSTTTYIATATNQCGSDTESITVNVAQPLNVLLSGDDILCRGDSSGSISAATLGGGGNPIYTWSPSPPLSLNGNAQSNLPAGSYRVDVVDDAGCTDSDSITLVEPPSLSIQVNSIVNNLCQGDNEGVIDLVGSGGSPGYQYALSGPTGNGPFVNSGLFDQLPAGTYTVDVMDANGCMESIILNITEPAVGINISILSKVDASCGIRGELEVGVTGGTSPYSFSLNNGPGSAPSINSTQFYTNLNPGYYEVEVTDANGCSSLIGDTVREIDPPIVTIDSLADATCFATCDGYVAFSVNLGSPPYTLALDANPTSDTVFNNLCPGYHFFQVEDGNACKFGLVFFIDQPDSLSGRVINETFPLCENDANGVLVVQGQGGTQPYSYSIDGGNTFQGGTFSGLDSGLYDFVLADDNGCRADFQGSLVDPDPLRIEATATDIACAGEQNGRVEVSASGGSPDYEYSFESSPFVDDSLFFGLGAGTYEVRVEDAQGCRDTGSVTVTEPQVLVLNIESVRDANCRGAADGSVSLAANGGSPPFEYSQDQINYSSIPSFDSLRAGSYNFYVRDSRGCEAEVSASVGEPGSLFGSVDWKDITCAGANDGGGTLSMTGGTPPYTYRWSNGESGPSVDNLPPGNPFVVVEDQNGCQVAFSGDLIDPPVLFVDSTDMLDASCFGSCDGYLFAAGGGGTPPYSYIWSNGSTDSLQRDVCANTYVLSLVDNNGCEVLDTLEVGQPSEIIIDIVDQKDASCGLANGEVTVAASGGAGGFSYQWSNGETGPTASELLGGILPPVIYQVVVTDSTNCINTLAVQIGVGAAPEADFETEFSPLDSLLFPEDGVEFINLSVNATDYLWLFGDGNVSDEENPTHVFPGPGVYEITLIAYDPAFQCPDTAKRTIAFYPPGRIYVPTAFTPNNDNTNDEFFAVGAGVITMRIDLFDRWGRHLRTLNSLEETWDGNNKLGNPVQEGVYVWKLEATLNDQVRVQRVGTVTLIR